MARPNHWPAYLTPGRQMLEPKYPMSLDVRRRCFRGLVKLCGEYGILPSSHIICESKVHKLGDPFTSGGSSYVWPGMYDEDGDWEEEDGGRCVAIKVIQYSELDDFQTIRKVRCLTRRPRAIESDR